MSEPTEKIAKNPNLSEAREHFKEARKAMHKSMEALIPPGYLEARRAARKEFLLGLRKLVDVAIDHFDEHEKKS